MLSSLRFRLWLTYVLIVAIVIVIAGAAVVFYLVRNPVLDRRELQRLRLTANLLVQRNQILNSLDNPFSREYLGQAVRRADSATSARIAIYAATGEVLADSRANSATALPELSTLLTRDAKELTVYRDSQLRQWLYVLAPFETQYYLLAAAPRPRLSAMTLLRDELLAPFVRGALLALVLSLIMAFWIANWITRPLQRMADAARSMSAGKFQRISLQGPGEVQDLAKAFNQMGEQVQASQRSQRDFIANVSHDLKTPLTSIQGFAQAILDGAARQPAELQQAAGVIHTEAGRMHRMVLELLELARLDARAVNFERSRLEIGGLLQGVVERFGPQSSQSQVSLRFSAADDLPALVGDPERLAQVFANLVENAFKYTPGGGEIILSAQSSGNMVEVSVADTGPGIPAEQLPRIFERFYQTDKSRTRGSGGGVGLGLAIAREIIQAHGGTISATNRNAPDAPRWAQAAQGSVFVVRLPAPRTDDSTLVRRR